MKRLTLSLFALATVAVIGGLSPAQWGSGGCGPAGVQLHAPVFFAQRAVAQSAPVAETEWRRHPGHPNEVYLYRKGIQIGGYSYAESCWREYHAETDTWGERVPCKPEEVPAIVDRPKSTIPMPPTGVNWDMISPTPVIKLHDKKGDREITRKKAIEEIEKPTTGGKDDIPDDTKKFRLTVIGSAADRKAVTDEWAKVEPAIKDRVITWSLPADHWAVTDSAGKASFKADGKPTVYLQAPGGKVLHRQSDAVGAVEAVRKGISSYDSNKDPDLRKPVLPSMPVGGVHPLPIALLGVGGVVAGTLATRKRQQ